VTVEEMSVSYMQEEEPLDPLEIYIANQQAIRKQTPSVRNPPSPDLYSDSEDYFEIDSVFINYQHQNVDIFDVDKRWNNRGCKT